MRKLVGILAAHGSREEHAHMMNTLGCDTIFLRSPQDFEGIDGIILPGGESPSFGRLLKWSNMRDIMIEYISERKVPVFGTCAGAILLAKTGSEYALKSIDMDIDRNAYGRQVDSFSDEIEIQGCNTKFHGVFIRAPKITRAGENLTILASYNNDPILVQEGNVLSSTFHPELTKDTRVHEIFLEMMNRESK